MNKSEQLLSAFSEDYFFKELVVDELHFKPDKSSEREVADLLINLDDIIIAIQLKARNDKDQTGDFSVENKWLQKKCRVAKGQVKETLQFISSGTLPAFCNKRGQEVFIRSDAEVIPLVVFENNQIEDYPHLLRKHSDSGMNINCMSFSDYCEMCRVLVTPIEIVEYLEYRKKIYEECEDVDFIIFNGMDNEMVLTKPRKNESLVHQFLAEKYGMKESDKQKLPIQYFRNFLRLLPERSINNSEEDASYEVLLFLAHFNRGEIIEFWELFEQTKSEAKQGLVGIRHSLRSSLENYVVMFMTPKLLPIEVLLPIIQKVVEPKQVLEIAINWFDEESFGVDFLFYEASK